MPGVPEVPGAPVPPGSRLDARSAAFSLALLAGSVLLGLLGGLIWGEVAPRVLYQEISPGVAEVVNDETRAFFGADAWFCLIALVAGVVTGVLGYQFGVARRTGLARAAAATCLILGALGGGLAMMWLGGQIGLSGYNHQLASSADGTLFYASLSLGAKSALACWPLFTSVVLVIAEWGNRPAPARGGPPPDEAPERGRAG
jgi:hypothetical protein